jgi:hypothetical protein
MRRTVRGHHVMVSDVKFMLPKKPGGGMLYSLRARCPICGTAWSEDVSRETGLRMLAGPNQRRTVAEVVAIAVARTPRCEEAYLEMVAREVIET